MHQVPFCDRNWRPWAAVLGAGAVVVFAYALSMAWGRGEFGGFHLRRGARGGAGTDPVATASLGSAVPVGLATRWQPSPSSRGQAPGTRVGMPSGGIDAMSSATPLGGIRFVAGSQAIVLQTAFNRAADVIRPCVVNINAVRAEGVAQVPRRPESPRFVDPFDGVPDKLIGQMPVESVGSGVILDPAGYVVTNYHVIEGASIIVVSRFNRQEEHLAARLVASDPGNDLALLKLDGAGPYPVATLANSSLVEVGDWVLAVGNPFGLGHTVTSGIISGRRASMIIAGVRYKGLIQTDAPINVGSSGGPLVNLDGQVVGINTVIYAPTGVFSGTGFAIPSSRVGAFVARELQRPATAVAMQTPAFGGSLPYLGVGIIDMTPPLARKLAYPYAGGVFLSSIVLDSPADEAELARGDVLTSLAGQPIRDGLALNAVVSQLAAGRPVPVTVWSDGRTERHSIRPEAGRRAGQ